MTIIRLEFRVTFNNLERLSIIFAFRSFNPKQIIMNERVPWNKKALH